MCEMKLEEVFNFCLALANKVRKELRAKMGLQRWNKKKCLSFRGGGRRGEEKLQSLGL